MKKHNFVSFLSSLINPQFAPTVMKVALIVGSILFAINHSNALLQGKMTRSRWLSAALTYLVPYTVSIHGQFSGQNRQKENSINR